MSKNAYVGVYTTGSNSGTLSNNLGTFTIINNYFDDTNGEDYFSNLVGKGVNSTQTTTNYYSSSSSQIAVFTYSLAFTNIPSNATITRVYCQVNGHAKSASNANEYMCVQLKTGNTNLTNEYNFKTSGTDNTTITLEPSTIPTISQLASLVLYCRLGYYGGAINGATCYVEYTLPTTGSYVARKVTKAYIGINGVARKIKKGYIGVGGVARLWFYNEKQISYYGKTSSGITSGTYQLAGGSIGNYAVFAGGVTSSPINTVYSYNTSLSRGTPTGLSQARSQFVGSSNGTYLIFGGGVGYYYPDDIYSSVDAYSTSLAKASSPSSLSSAKIGLASTPVGDYVLFAGGYGSSGYLNTVEAYNKTLQKTTPTYGLTYSVSDLAGASIGNYALFAGGQRGSSTYTSVINVYDTTLTRTNSFYASSSRSGLRGASTNNHVFFVGGHNKTSNLNTVDAYDSSLVQVTPTLTLNSTSFYYLTVGVSTDDFAFFTSDFESNYTEIDVFNSSLIRIDLDLNTTRHGAAGASVGNYILVAGGDSNGSVEAYQIT